MLKAILCASVLAAIAAPAAAHPLRCSPVDIAGILEKQLGELPLFVAKTPDGVEITGFLNKDTGSWTIMGALNGRYCNILGGSEGFGPYISKSKGEDH